MYAIVEIAGQQFKVQKDQKIFVHRLNEEAGKKVTFDKVLLIDNGGKITLGAPAIKGASVSAKVDEHVKGDKVIVFRKKRRKGYAKRNGHRQQFTALTIQDIKASGSAPSATAKAEKPEEVKETKATAKSEVKKAPAKKAAPKATAKKAPAKKPAAKKTTAKKEDNK